MHHEVFSSSEMMTPKIQHLYNPTKTTNIACGIRNPSCPSYQLLIQQCKYSHTSGQTLWHTVHQHATQESNQIKICHCNPKMVGFLNSPFHIRVKQFFFRLAERSKVSFPWIINNLIGSTLFKIFLLLLSKKL